MPAPPPPLAVGDLAATPLAHALVFVRTKGLTGDFELVARDGSTATLAFASGHVVDARVDDVDAPPRGETARERTLRRAASLFAWGRETRFAFFGRAARSTEIVIDPLEVVWRGINAHPDDALVRDMLRRVGDAPLRMADETVVIAAKLAPEEIALCGRLADGPMPLAQLTTANLAPARAERLAYLLFIAKGAVPVGGARATPSPGPLVPPLPSLAPRITPSPGPLVPPAAPSGPRATFPSISPETPASMPPHSRPSPHVSGEFLRTSVPPAPSRPSLAPAGPAELGASGIAQRAQMITREEPHLVLGVAPNASAEKVRAAFVQLARLWHPDRLPGDLAAFRSEVETIYATLNRAHEILVAGSTGENPSLGATRDRTHALRDIDQALERRELTYPRLEATRLADADDDDAAARAIVVWCEALAGEAPEDVLRASVAKLDRLAASDRFCDRAYFYRGMIWKRLDNHAAAMRDFARVVALVPRHVEAQRELRVYEMRAKKSGFPLVGKKKAKG